MRAVSVASETTQQTKKWGAARLPISFLQVVLFCRGAGTAMMVAVAMFPGGACVRGGFAGGGTRTVAACLRNRFSRRSLLRRGKDRRGHEQHHRQPPNFEVSSHRMASRWCAIISACQTSPTAMMLIATMHTAITKVFCVSEAGMWRQRPIQAIVRGLLVLGPHAVDPTRELPGRRGVASAIVRATKWPVRDD